MTDDEKMTIVEENIMIIFSINKLLIDSIYQHELNGTGHYATILEIQLKHINNIIGLI